MAIALGRLFAPEAFAALASPTAWLGMWAGSPIAVPLVPMFSLWDGWRAGDPVFVPNALVVVAYFALLPLTYYLVRRPR